MTKQMIEHYIEMLKIKENRFFCGIAVSCLLDITLAAFYFIQAVGFGGNLWRFSNTVYYILLLTGKIDLLIWGRNGDSLKGTCKAASIVLILTGVFAMGRTYQYIKMDRILTFSRSIYILNGIILILRMLIYPLFQRYSKKEPSDKPESQINLLNPIRRGYTWAENLIAFSLLFTNLITIYGWDADNDLILSNILQGQAIGLIILAIGINLLLKSAKMCNQSEPLV